MGQHGARMTNHQNGDRAGQGGAGEEYALAGEWKPLPSETNEPRQGEPCDTVDDGGVEEIDAEESRRLLWQAIRRPPPRRLFFRGTFGFPFRVGSLAWTIALSFGAMAAIGFPVATWLTPDESQQATLMVLMALSGQIVLLTLWLVLASGVGLVVLRDTSYGYENVEQWPGLAPSELVGDAMYVFSSFALAAFLGMLASPAYDWLRLWRPLGIGLVSLLLFPIFLLSMLEANSPLNPLSFSVWRSVVQGWRAWGLFYLTSFGGLLLSAAIAMVSMRWGGLWIGVAAVGAAVSSAWIVYFRLLGRLAWFCAGEAEAVEDGLARGEAV